ncbi:MAG TPA: hypothetical protein VEH04_02445 [Verrucomicrobiae bacterium]|nr:hypothetical protein [Verrucomicrobiae bacterium]
MARNRRTQTAAIRFGPAIKAFLLCLLIGGSGVGYVWQKGQIEELALQIRRSEQELDALKAQNVKLRNQLAMMHLPRFLEAKIKELNLGLVPAVPSQKWVLKEPAGEAQHVKSDTGKQYAEH